MKTSKKLYLVSLWKMSDVINVRINYNFLCVSLGFRALPLEKCLPQCAGVRWVFHSLLPVFSPRYTNALRPAGHQAKRLCRLQPEDQGPLPAEGPRQVLARGLPQVCLLWLQAGRGGLHALHQSQPHPVPERLPTVRERQLTFFFFLQCLCDVQQTRLTIQKTQSGHSVCNGVTALTHSNPLYTHLEFLLSSFFILRHGAQLEFYISPKAEKRSSVQAWATYDLALRP